MREPDARVTVVGIGADGTAGLSPAAEGALRAAEVVMGSTRQLAALGDGVAAERLSWPSPMLDALPSLLAENADRQVCVLASGDPMFFGVGGTLVRLLGPERVHVIPHPSSASLACGRMGWALDKVDVVSLVGRPLETLHPSVQPGRRVLVLSSDGRTPASVAALLTERGCGDSELSVLEQLGGPDERRLDGVAGEWPHGEVGPLNVIAIDVRPEPGAPLLPRTPGLPDDAFENDGQLTKREIRAITLSRLAPVPGQLLWDVGAGAGSIGIEWMRSHPACRAIAVEAHAERAARCGRNAAALGVPGLDVVTGSAPDALRDLERPDAVFVGGAVTVPGVVQTCWDSLAPGGRMVVNAVTLESEAVLADWYERLGGELVRTAVSRGSPVGKFTGWRTMMPVTTWKVSKR